MCGAGASQVCTAKNTLADHFQDQLIFILSSKVCDTYIFSCFSPSHLGGSSPSTSYCEAQGMMHCKENPFCVFPEKKLLGLSPNFHSLVSVSDFYIPRIGRPIFLQQNKQTERVNIKIAH
jgi:hypothetical protein